MKYRTWPEVIGTETINQIRSDDGMNAYAERMLGLRVTADNPAAVDRCVAEHFGGKWREFAEAADEFIGGGFGVVG